MVYPRARGLIGAPPCRPTPFPVVVARFWGGSVRVSPTPVTPATSWLTLVLASSLVATTPSSLPASAALLLSSAPAAAIVAAPSGRPDGGDVLLVVGLAGGDGDCGSYGRGLHAAVDCVRYA